jgi:SWIM zinc finger
MHDALRAAEQLVSEDRVHLYNLDDSDLVAIVDGEDGVRGVTLSEAGWDCSCSKRLPCEHSLATAVAVAVSESGGVHAGQEDQGDPRPTQRPPTQSD